MALFAAYLDMLAGQRKLGFAVIEFGFLPVAIDVAVGTIGAQRALVLVILAMAGIACGGGLTVFLFRFVTILALHFILLLMRALQREIGFGMVKFRRIQNDDFGVTPLVVGMAGATFFFVLSTVESFVIQEIRPHLLVTIGTQLVLRVPLERDVAFRTLGLKFGMARDYLTGHQYRLNLRPCSTRTE